MHRPCVRMHGAAAAERLTKVLLTSIALPLPSTLTFSRVPTSTNTRTTRQMAVKAALLLTM